MKFFYNNNYICNFNLYLIIFTISSENFRHCAADSPNFITWSVWKSGIRGHALDLTFPYAKPCFFGRSLYQRFPFISFHDIANRTGPKNHHRSFPLTSTGPMDSSPVDPPPMMRHCSSSSGNISTTSISSDREELRPIPRIRLDPQIPEIILPPIHVPPEKTEITSYSILLHHLQQSDLIFDAFQKKFGMTVPHII